MELVNDIDEIREFFRELAGLAKASCIEVSDGLRDVNRWIKKIFAILIFLPICIITMELCLSENVNYVAVPFVSISLIVISTWLIFVELQPIGVILVGIGPSLPPVKELRLAGAWKKVIHWVKVIYGTEILFCLVVWLVFTFFPVRHIHPLLIAFFVISSLWVLLVVAGQGPRKLAVTIPIMVMLVGLLVLASLGSRPPTGFHAWFKVASRNFTEENPSSITVSDLPRGGWTEYNLPIAKAWMDIRITDESTVPDAWIALSCSEWSDGKEIVYGEKDPDRATINSTFAEVMEECPAKFFAQGPGGFTIAPVPQNQLTENASR